MNAMIDVEKKIESYQELINLFQRNPTLNSLGEFKKGLTKMSTYQLELEKQKVIYNKDATPLLQKMDNSRRGLILGLQQISGILKLSASAKKNKKLSKKFGFLVKDFNKITDTQLIKQAQKTISVANKLTGYSIASVTNITPKAFSKKIDRAKELSADFGLTAEKIKLLEEASVAFLKSIIDADDATKEKMKSLKAINKVFERNEKLLEKKLDKFVSIYEKPGTSFMNDYAGLRSMNGHVKKISESVQIV